MAFKVTTLETLRLTCAWVLALHCLLSPFSQPLSKLKNLRGFSQDLVGSPFASQMRLLRKKPGHHSFFGFCYQKIKCLKGGNVCPNLVLQLVSSGESLALLIIIIFAYLHVGIRGVRFQASTSQCYLNLKMFLLYPSHAGTVNGKFKFCEEGLSREYRRELRASDILPGPQLFLNKMIN